MDLTPQATMASPADALNLRIRELEAQNQQLTREVEHLRLVNANQALLINTHESLHRVFTCFARLPPELRIRIWQFTMSPMVLEVSQTSETDDVLWVATRSSAPHLLSRVQGVERPF